MEMNMHQEQGMPEKLFFTKNDVGVYCNLAISEIEELMEYGAIQLASHPSAVQHFSRPCVVMLQAANQLRLDYDLDLFTIVVIMDFLKRIQILEQKIEVLESRKANNVSAM